MIYRILGVAVIVAAVLGVLWTAAFTGATFLFDKAR